MADQSIISVLNMPINSAMIGGAIAAGFGALSSWLVGVYDKQEQKKNYLLSVCTDLLILKIHLILHSETLASSIEFLEADPQGASKVGLKPFAVETCHALLVSHPSFLDKNLSRLLVVLCADVVDMNFTIASIQILVKNENKAREMKKLQNKLPEVLINVDQLLTELQKQTAAQLILERNGQTFRIQQC